VDIKPLKLDWKDTWTEEEISKVRTLARQVARDRPQRMMEKGTTKKGRIIGCLAGEPSAAEIEWDALVERGRP
jgi:hypothetical protein